MLLKKLISFDSLIFILLLSFGLYTHVFLPLGVSLDFIYGDLGDARFNNYLLEHNYLFFTGKIDSYWSANFMFPNENVIAISDNLMGSSPFYMLFRVLTFDTETSYQLWFIFITLLNFFCSFFVFNKLSRNVSIAAIGAFIFAFNISLFGQYNHLQVLPRFITPIAIYYLIEFIKSKNLNHYTIFIFALVYQFYCGIYLGFILLLTILFIFIYSLIIDYKSYYQLIKNRLQIFKLTGITILAGVFLLVLIYPYYLWSKQLGGRNFNEVADSLPTIFSYLSPVNGTLLWKNLENLFELPIKWDHLLFPGAIPILSVFIFIPILIKFKNREYSYYFIGFLLLFVFTLRIVDFTLYKVIFFIPGFNSMRSLGRVINIELFFFALFTVWSLKYFVEKAKYKYLTIFIAFVFIIIDQTVVLKPSAVYNKFDSQNRIKNLLGKAKNIDETHCFAYVPKIIEYPNFVYNIDAMLLSQKINVPTINGYSATCPNSICNFITSLDTTTLYQWTEQNKILKNKIIIID